MIHTGDDIYLALMELTCYWHVCMVGYNETFSVSLNAIYAKTPEEAVAVAWEKLELLMQDIGAPWEPEEWEIWHSPKIVNGN